MSDEEAVGHGTTLITVSSRSLLETIPLGRTGHHWDPYKRHGYGREGKERKDHGSVFV